MSILIGKMQKTDSNSWAAMRSMLWDRLCVEAYLSDIEKVWSGERATGYIAQIPDCTAVGFADISIRDYGDGCAAQPAPFLEEIRIDPSLCRNGIGRLLTTNITGDLIARGFQALCSDEDITNQRSHHAHKRWDFLKPLGSSVPANLCANPPPSKPV